jgi:hypothetical protein
LAEACDFLLIHFNGVPIAEIGRRIDTLKQFGKPVVCNEDNKLDDEGARAAEVTLGHGASWGFMAEQVNQHFPFTFRGADDDPVVYEKLKQLTTPWVFPGKAWAEKMPSELGLDRAKLDRLAGYLGGQGCAIRHGFIGYSWGDVTRRTDVASACKPWYTHFLLLAIEEGKLSGIDDTVAAYEPRLSQLNSALGFKDRRILWRHLACQTSCYGVREVPGAAFDYSDFNMALFFDTLFHKVYTTTRDNADDSLLRPKLTNLIGCQDEPSFMAFGTDDRPGRLAISVRDFARFGLLYLHEGHWSGRQLLRADLARLAVSSPLAGSFARTKGKHAEMIPEQRSLGGGNNQSDHLGSYSFAWWTNGTDRTGQRHWPSAPNDVYGAFGHGGKRAMVVVPSLDLVVSWNDAGIEGREMEDHALNLVAAAACQSR